MNQESNITRRLAEAQEQHANGKRPSAPAFNALKTLYRIYTEYVLSRAAVAAIIGRYFEGATITSGLGLDARTQDSSEEALIIEIVSSAPDALQRILFLAGDLRQAQNQISVLVTQQPVTTFEVTADVGSPRISPTESPTVNLRSRAQAHRLAGLDTLKG